MTDPQSNRLAILAGQIVADLTTIHRDAQSMAEHMLAVGHALLEAKRSLPHGAFDEWLASNVAMSGRSARRYMRLAALGLKSDTVAELGLTGALAPLSKISRPGPGEAVLGRDGSGWQWAIWRGDWSGPWFHVWAFHDGLAEEVATIKPLKWVAVAGQIQAFGLDIATLRFELPVRADLRWLEAERSDVVGQAGPLSASAAVG